MTQIREPAVAGLFYPASPGELSMAVNDLMLEQQAVPAPAPKALIVPHAGYGYSGPVAASAYVRLGRYPERYRRVVLIGPSHHWPLAGIALSPAETFRTPLGDIPLDCETIGRLRHPAVHRQGQPHDQEHSLEVQLPFLQEALTSFSIIPMVVGDCPVETVAEVIEQLWGGPETLLVASSDLSHYLTYEEAVRRDAKTCRRIESFGWESLGPHDACGGSALRGLLMAASRRGLENITLDLRNSGDMAGNRERVVGYGAWVLTEPRS